MRQIAKPDGYDTLLLIDQLIPGLAAVSDNVVVRIENSV
jgi:hypothetical protein